VNAVVVVPCRQRQAPCACEYAGAKRADTLVSTRNTENDTLRKLADRIQPRGDHPGVLMRAALGRAV